MQIEKILTVSLYIFYFLSKVYKKYTQTATGFKYSAENVIIYVCIIFKDHSNQVIEFNEHKWLIFKLRGVKYLNFKKHS